MATIDLTGCRGCNRFEKCREEGKLIVWTEANDMIQNQHAMLGVWQLCPKEVNKLLEESGFEL